MTPAGGAASLKEIFDILGKKARAMNHGTSVGNVTRISANAPINVSRCRNGGHWPNNETNESMQRETSLHIIIHNSKLFSVSYSSFSAASVGEACIQRSRGVKGNDNGPTMSYHSITIIGD